MTPVRFRLVLVLVFAGLSAGCVLTTRGQTSGILFRYLPGQEGLSSTTVFTDVETGPFLDPREMVARAPGGWGMAAPQSAEFGGPGSTLRSASSETRFQPLGPHLTLEVWFRSDLDAPTALLLTNRVAGGTGFSIGLDGGKAYAVLDTGSQRHRLETSTVVEANTDHWLAATIQFFSGQLSVSLYLDGRLLGNGVFPENIPSPYGIEAPFFVGTRASGTRDAPVLTGEFVGHVFGAMVREYEANPLYLASAMPDDGGAYFGLPAYHDYALDAFHVPMDQRISRELVEVKDRLFLPYANDLFIPQGVATRTERTSDGDTPLVYVAYYHRTRTGSLGGQRSIVVEIEVATGKVRRTFRLMGELGFSHVGGVAFSHDALYISSVGTLERYPVPEFAGPEGERYLDLAADNAARVRVQSKASFISAFRDTLWVGDWRTASDVKPFLYAHALDGNGRPEQAASRVFAIPRNVQGVDLFERGGRTHVLLSRNRSSTQAELLRFPVESLQPILVATADTAITMPFGIEDLSFSEDGALWTNSESGTDYYQRKPQGAWLPFYPFVYSVSENVVFGDITTTAINRTEPGGPDLELSAYPTPFTGTATISLAVGRRLTVRVYVIDLLGRQVATLLEGAVGPGTLRLRWRPPELAAGLFFAVADVGAQRLVRPLILAR
jgi:concanavalin A-like lectin/glucanase superfamily protein